MGETLPNKNDRDVSVEMQPPDPEAPVRLATFDQYRSLLFSVAYRMLGSVADAEDMLQETFMRWQQAPDQEIRSAYASIICNPRGFNARSTSARGSRNRSLPVQEAIRWNSYGSMNRFPWRSLSCWNA